MDLELADPAQRQRQAGANAYSPEQWASVFEAQLGPSSMFGAVWDQ